MGYQNPLPSSYKPDLAISEIWVKGWSRQITSPENIVLRIL